MKYTNFEILPEGNLKITLTKDGKTELVELKEKYGENDEAILTDLIEYQLGNGFHWVMPEDIGALTDSLIISDAIIDGETTKDEMNDTKIWWFPNYQVQSYIDGIENEGVIFTRVQ